MSVIAGIFRLSGPPVVPADLSPMLDRLSYYGPDGEGVWCRGHTGLGHRMLYTTPESLHEKLPLFDRTAESAITADARIDNRRDLIRALERKAVPGSDVTDSELILAAYQRWGESCVEKLLGDFAFVIWDGRKQQVFCARDHFGAKAFFYYRSDKLFAFATEAKALFGLPEVPRCLNESRVGDYLAGALNDKEITFFKDILRLPPAHTLTVRRDGVRMHQYWTLNPSLEVRRTSDAEYAEEFRSLFTEAVRCRMRSAYPVGAMLSGGLDSSSVACVARNLLIEDGQGPLHTFSALFDGLPEVDERTYIEAVLRTGGFLPHDLHAESVSPFADWDSLLWHLGEPHHRPNITLQKSIYLQAEENGVRIVLDGLGGDGVISHGTAYLWELLQSGRWTEFGIQAEGLASHFQRNHCTLLKQYLTPYLSETMARRDWTSLARAYGRMPFQTKYPLVRFYLDYGLRPLARRVRWRLLGPPRDLNGTDRSYSSIINKPFADSISLEDRVRRMRANLSERRTESGSHYSQLTSGRTPLALEEFSRVAAPSRVEVRYPHYDKRLVEFCFGLPPSQKLWQGWSRMILRRAMNQILPEEVLWRGGKADLFVPFEHTLRKYGQDYLEEAIQRMPPGVEKYFDLPVLRERYQRYRSGTVSDATAVWSASCFIWWLQKSGLTPAIAAESSASSTVQVAACCDERVPNGHQNSS